MANGSSQESIFVTTALTAWKQWTDRLTKTVESVSDEKLLAEIAPGKNRLIYILGHLIAVNDAMMAQLRLGDPQYAHLWDPFVSKPDHAVADLPSVTELRQNWKDLNARLDTAFQQLTPDQWLERHSAVSEEDFAKEPHRNRLAILLSRTSHSAYHLGQLMLAAK
jgi:uncharacterized damage-inducible protein DinB